MTPILLTIETGTNSSVSEIEPSEVIEPVKTVEPEITHEEYVHVVEDPTANQANEIEVSSVSTVLEKVTPETHQPESPEHVPEQVREQVPEREPTEQDHEEESSQPEEPQTIGSNLQKKRRRKGKVSEFQEDNLIDADFASRLDMTCIEGTAAPAVNDAYVVEYIPYYLTAFYDF